MALTKEQTLAVNLENTNIIVSAGAGSGKTFVLTERVKRKILDGVHVNQLLVLTFTNAAAQEMKDRIREVINNTKGLENEKDLVDSAYITTFDSFSLSIVRKYHTLLNVSNNIGISDEIIIDLEKRKILDEIMDMEYLSNKSEFLKLINCFCLKDDNELKDAILEIYKKIELKYDKTKFLNNYFREFNEERNKNFVLEYVSLLKRKRDIVKDLMNDLNSYFDGDFVTSMYDNYRAFLEADSYEDFVKAMDYGTVRVPRGSSEEGKLLKGRIVDLVKEFKEDYLIYDNSESILDELNSTITNVEVIVSILTKLDQRLEEFKRREEVYNFNDIARMAIQVVEDNENIREELANSFQEIMVDEYQDTSDVQEKFISLIAHNNVYMVGDIKQSIYRFRNANPSIFRYKYNLFRDTDEGEKIDLLNNFRSRDEVLKDINLLFDDVMDEELGGAEYQVSHRMVFGNNDYLKEDSKQDYHMDVITYDKKELGMIRNNEEEAFIIAKDIKDKISNHYKIFDKKKKVLRDAEYKDFVILLDRGTDFNLYKKVFEYFQIPLNILKEESFSKDYDASIFKNLLKFIICIKENRIDSEAEYSFVSLSRSFLFKISDEEIYDYYLKKNYNESDLYKFASKFIDVIDNMSTSQFIRHLLNELDYDLKLLSLNNIKQYRVRSEYFYNLSCDYEKTGKTVYDFVNYLDHIFDEEYDLKFNVNNSSGNSCMIMTIHKSKGLEYPVCYFAGLTVGFNLGELKERILFDNQYGIILPKVDNYYKDTVLKILLKYRVRREEIAEKIRLLYVATTRAREKMIFVMPEDEEVFEVRDIIPSYIREKYNSFYSIMKSIYSLLVPYIKKSSVIANRDYLIGGDNNKLPDAPIYEFRVEDFEIENEIIEDAHYSKEQLHVITKEEKDMMEFGTKVHEILELMDFNKKDILNELYNSYIKNKINSFLDSEFMSDKLDKEMYKEYEFLYLEENTLNHGIIDLLIDMGDYYVIVDYKLKNIDDILYDRQLNGYRKYIISNFGRRCECYLYSIMNEEYREVLDES